MSSDETCGSNGCVPPPPSPESRARRESLLSEDRISTLLVPALDHYQRLAKQGRFDERSDTTPGAISQEFERFYRKWRMVFEVQYRDDLVLDQILDALERQVTLLESERRHPLPAQARKPGSEKINGSHSDVNGHSSNGAGSKHNH